MDCAHSLRVRLPRCPQTSRKVTHALGSANLRTTSPLLADRCQRRRRSFSWPRDSATSPRTKSTASSSYLVKLAECSRSSMRASHHSMDQADEPPVYRNLYPKPQTL